MIKSSAIVRNSGITKDNSSQVVVSVSSSSSGGTIIMGCDPALNIGNFVYISGDKTVAQADSSSLLTLPAIGMIIEKPTVNTCNIQMVGEAPLTRDPVLTPNTKYYIASNGEIKSSTEFLTPPLYFQLAGVANSTNKLILSLGLPLPFVSQ